MHSGRFTIRALRAFFRSEQGEGEWQCTPLELRPLPAHPVLIERTLRAPKKRSQRPHRKSLSHSKTVATVDIFTSKIFVIDRYFISATVDCQEMYTNISSSGEPITDVSQATYNKYF